MSKAIHAYHALGLDFLALTVNDNNPKAQALYRKMGLNILRYRGKYEKRVSL
jgi:ribosomal protein S18 acetylase RimI-like enzyme